MGKLIQRHEAQSTDEYVSALTRGLRRHLPQDKAAEIAGEARAHLLDRADELTGCGVARHEAEAIATRGFGPVKHYTRAAIESAYGDRTSRHFQQAVRLSLVCLWTLSVIRPLVSPNLWGTWFAMTLLPGMMSAAMLTFPLAAFAGRLPQTRTLTIYVASLAALSFLVSGLCYIPYTSTAPIQISGITNSWLAYEGGPGQPRGDYSAQIATLDNHYVYQEIKLLREGIAAYASDAPVPASLRFSGGYVVPRETGWEWCTKDSNALAFSHESQPQTHCPWDPISEATHALPLRTVATRAEATRIWQKTGPQWLAGKEKVRQRAEQVRGILYRASHTPIGFNTGAATFYGTNMLWGLPMILAIDFLMASLGRACWVLLRNRRRPHAA